MIQGPPLKRKRTCEDDEDSSFAFNAKWIRFHNTYVMSIHEYADHYSALVKMLDTIPRNMIQHAIWKNFPEEERAGAMFYLYSAPCKNTEHFKLCAQQTFPGIAEKLIEHVMSSDMANRLWQDCMI